MTLNQCISFHFMLCFFFGRFGKNNTTTMQYNTIQPGCVGPASEFRVRIWNGPDREIPTSNLQGKFPSALTESKEEFDLNKTGKGWWGSTMKGTGMGVFDPGALGIPKQPCTRSHVRPCSTNGHMTLNSTESIKLHLEQRLV